MAIPTLHTERLTLRAITLDDVPAIQRHFDNWNIIQHLTNQVPWPYPPDGAMTFVTEVVLPSHDAGTSLMWAITETGADELIGSIDFSFEDDGAGNRGFWLAEPYWGRGYVTEAVVAVQDHVLLDLGVERMTVLNAVTNPASRRVKEKTGARWIGQIELEHRNGEMLSDKWEVTRADWARHRNRSFDD